MSQPPIPTQSEVDLLAAFVETANELRSEPFFDLHENTSYSQQSDKLIVMRMGDRFHFRSALIPFRRLWRNGEDTYYEDILKLLERFPTDANTKRFIASVRAEHAKVENDPSSPPRVSLPGKQLVDGWLYSVFIHTNLHRKTRDPNRGFDRHTFENYLQQFGHAWLEYAFRHSVRTAGWLYFQILDTLATPLLDEWEATFGKKPSFRMVSAFGNSVREKSPDGTIIIRKASSFYGVDETLIQELYRLLQRFSLLRDTLKGLEMEPEELLKVVVGSKTVKQVIEKAGWEMHLAEHFKPTDEFSANHQYFDPQTKTLGNMSFSRERVMIVTKNTLRIWSRDFSRLKDLL